MEVRKGGFYKLPLMDFWILAEQISVVFNL